MVFAGVKISKESPGKAKEEAAKEGITFKHKRTIRRNVAESLGEKVEEGQSVCLICSQAVDGSSEDLSSHFTSRHFNVKGLEVPKNDSAKDVNQLFEIHHKIEDDGNSVKLLIKNIYLTGLQINQIQLIYETDKLFVLRHGWPAFIGIEETLEVPLERKFFQTIGRHYFFVIHAERIDEYLEVQRMTVKNTFVEKIKAKRNVKIRRAETYGFFSGGNRFRYLAEYPPDLGLLKLFTEDFLLKEEIEGLSKEEMDRYKDLITFKELNPGNYQKVLKMLVEIEDLYQNCVLRKFKIPEISVERPWNKSCINISKVSNLPDIIQEGDTIVLRKINNSTKELEEEFNLSIWKIADECIYFDQERKKHIPLSHSYLVKFKKDRTCPRMEQEALKKVDEKIINEVLFPKFHEKNNNFEDFSFEWFNPSIETNLEQQKAVENIVKSTSCPAPYIIFGPPGTGKTSTMVEAIAQVWKLKPEANILVTAPSNFACDEIAMRLMEYIPAEDMYRSYSRSATKRINEINDELILISNISNGIFKFPSMRLLKSFRIVLMTVVTSGKLALNGMEKDHFDYIFIDEAGSATESSAIIPISGLISCHHDQNDNDDAAIKTNVVIAGDPKQLGPVVACDFANLMGLGISLLERLMNMDIYKPDDEGHYNSHLITKLLQNFRSHAAILKTPSQLFYNDELIPKASPKITNFALNWEHLPNKEVPVIFHAVNGATRSTANCFSLFNEMEIDTVMFYVKEIVENGINGNEIALSEVGIVSPYRLQCQFLKKRLRFAGWKEIEVGSAEQFQGKEKKVIILSTVRSNTMTCGFLSNPKVRFFCKYKNFRTFKFATLRFF